MRIKLALVFLLLSCVPAMADPVTIGSAAISALYTVGIVVPFTYATAYLIGTAVIAGATYAISQALAPDAGSSINPAEFKQNNTNPNGPEVRAVGRVRLGGQFLFRNTSTTKSYRLVAQCKGPVDQIENYYIGGREVVVDVENNGAVKSPPWSRGNGSDYLFIESKVGDGTETAWSRLVSDFNDWTTDHKAQGVSQLLVRYVSPGISNSLYLKLYGSAGVRDNIETVVRAELVYDPREGSHNIEVPTTWGWSENGVLNATHMIRSLPGIEDSDIDWTQTGLEADKADVLVPTLNGTEKRSRAWGAWGSEGRKRNDLLRQMLDSIGGEIVQTSSGKIYIKLLEDNPASEIDFSDIDVVSMQLKIGPESVERPNMCRLFYHSPERNYELAEVPLYKADGTTPIPWSRIEPEIAVAGEQPLDISLPFCPSASQAQRIARRMFSIARAEFGAAVLNMSGVATWGKRVATFPLPDLENSIKCLISSPRIDDAAGTVEVPFIRVPDLDAYDANTDEAPPLPAIPDIEFETEFDTPAIPSDAIITEYPVAGTFELRTLFTAVTGVNQAEANYRRYTAGLPNSWVSMAEIGLTFANVSIADITGEKVDFRVRMSDGDEVSKFSETLQIASIAADNTKPSNPTISGDYSADEYSVVVNPPNQIRVVGVVITDEQTPANNGTYDVAYNGTVTIAGTRTGTPGTYTFTAKVITSDGTQSDSVSTSTVVNPQ